MGLAQIRRGLGHRPYRLAHRTPVLYSRNQSRTNIALLKKKDKRGGVSLPSCSCKESQHEFLSGCKERSRVLKHYKGTTPATQAFLN